MKKILAIAASPRRYGNSETLLDKALSALNSRLIKKVVLADLKILPCTGCGACFKTGKCVIKDDMQVLYEDLLEYDIILISSPIYFQGLPCQLKCVIDRCQALWARKYILRKVKGKRKKVKGRGAAILVSASRGAKNTFIGAMITLKAWFMTLGVVYKKEFLAEGLEKKNAATIDKKLLKKVIKWKKGCF